MSNQTQQVFTGVPPPIVFDSQTAGGNVANFLALSTPGTSTFFSTPDGSKVGLFGVDPVSQPTVSIDPVAVVGTDLATATFGGYTLAKIAAALQATGVLAVPPTA
jgi:hypothetical protein